METESCLSFCSQASRTTPESSPGLEHSSSSFLPCDELQKTSHAPHPHRLSLRADFYSSSMGRFSDAPADFTHGAAAANPHRASPSKHSNKFSDSINPDRKGIAISGKTAFYEINSEGRDPSMLIKQSF